MCFVVAAALRDAAACAGFFLAAANDTLSLLEITLHRFHARAPDDTPALDEILERSGISESRRAKIHAMF